MTHIKIYKVAIFSLAIVAMLSIFAGCFGYIYSLQHQSEDVGVTTSPHVFYSTLKVTKIDEVGNVQGITSVYRVDGMNGQPKLVTVLPGETFQQQIDFQAQSLHYDVVANHDLEFSKFPVTLDGQGHDISSLVKNTGALNTKDATLSAYQWIHPQGTYATVSEVYCTDTPEEGPCSQSYRMVITNLATNQKKTLTPKDFNGFDGQWLSRPLVELSRETALVSLEAMQEPLTAYLGIVNFTTGEIAPLYAMKSDYSGLTHKYEYLGLSADRQAAIFYDWDIEHTDRVLVAMNLSTGKFSTIATKLPDSAMYLLKDASAILYNNTTATKVIRRDLKTGQETVVAHTSIDMYLHPVRFEISTDTSSTGISGGKLILTDRLTGRTRTIFDQLQESNAYGPNVNGGASSKNAKIGSIIYQFVGIDQ